MVEGNTFEVMEQKPKQIKTEIQLVFLEGCAMRDFVGSQRSLEIDEEAANISSLFDDNVL